MVVVVSSRVVVVVGSRVVVVVVAEVLYTWVCSQLYILMVCVTLRSSCNEVLRALMSK